MSVPDPPSSSETESTAPAATEARPRRRYARERNFVGAVFFALTGAVIVNGGLEIYRETYRAAVVPPPAPTCSEGLHYLFNAFQAQLGAVRQDGSAFVLREPWTDPSIRARLDAIDERFRAMRPVCEREGAAAREAYDALTLWRHHAEDTSRIEQRTLTSDAQRALRYHSPGQSAP